ncbi:MAG: ferritin family protein [Myxococcales bacterium]|nr:ferritin family protein [Myxococcales bacterium]
MKWSAIEICKIGVEVERNGRAFYLKARDKVADEDLQKLFSRLADAELIHEKTYLQILERLEIADPAESECCYDQEYDIYLGALADTRVFTPQRTVDQIIAPLKTPSDLLRVAMGFEKDAILWLSEMINLVADDEKPVIEEFISYEKEHLAVLMTELKKLSA